jgi:hypothetical protein
MIANLFRFFLDRLSAAHYRAARARAFMTWAKTFDAFSGHILNPARAQKLVLSHCHYCAGQLDNATS